MASPSLSRPDPNDVNETYAMQQWRIANDPTYSPVKFYELTPGYAIHQLRSLLVKHSVYGLPVLMVAYAVTTSLT